MCDFGRLDSASLWKSAPLFSTGTKEAELMVKELRWNLRSPAAPFVHGCAGVGAGRVERGVGPRLSTVFAERQGLSSPGSRVLVHR